MNWTQFKNSSQKAQYAYDGTRSVLIVEFSDGAQYEYSGVTQQQALDLLAAPFTGKHFHRNFRNNADHPCKKIKPAVAKLPDEAKETFARKFVAGDIVGAVDTALDREPFDEAEKRYG